MIFTMRYINLFVFTLFLVTLIGSFEGASSSDLFIRNETPESPEKPDTSDPPSPPPTDDTEEEAEWCKGYRFDLTLSEVKNGTVLLVTWLKGESIMNTTLNCEAFGGDGVMTFWKEIWTGNLRYDNGVTSVAAPVKISAPEGTELPQVVKLRTWGASDTGPKCTIFTKTFTLVA